LHSTHRRLKSQPLPEDDAASRIETVPGLDRARTVLEIDLAAIVANWRFLNTQLGPATRCGAVVKADAYGLGMARVAPALARAGCRFFFVAYPEEAIALRGLLPEAEIAVLNGLPPGAASEFARHRLLPVLNDLAEIEEWRRFALTRPAALPAGSEPGLPALIQIDTGMARLGLSAKNVARLESEPALLQGIHLRAVMSHLACADEAEHPANAAQHASFTQLAACLPEAPKSLAASAGIFLGRPYHFDLVRPGAALYGLDPRPTTPRQQAAGQLAQVVHLKARILQLREIDAGGSVGYGASHRMARQGRLAVIGTGYGEGWLRSLSNRGKAAINGKTVPVVGRISMDLVTLDVTNIDPSRLQVGDFVELIGPDRDLAAVAAEAGTIGYEVLTGLAHHRDRVYRGETG
jgi:alanine racemase